MPEMHLLARWPDGATHRHYSPSLVLAEHLEIGVAYPVADFVERTSAALRIASDRVQARYGFPCSLAAVSIARIEQLAASARAGDVVRVEAFERD